MQRTYTLDHARNALLLIARGASGVYHMCSLGEASFCDLARACLEGVGLAREIEIDRLPAEAFARIEQASRPPRTVIANDRLDHEGLNRQRPWRDALAEYLDRPHFSTRCADADVVRLLTESRCREC